MFLRIISTILVLSLFYPLTTWADSPFTFGLLLVGSRQDGGWSQSQYEAGLSLVKQDPSLKMVVVDRVNPGNKPGLVLNPLVKQLVKQGSRLIIANSGEMENAILKLASRYPSVYFVVIAGKKANAPNAPPNYGNLFGKIYFGEFLLGVAAAMVTKTGKIGVVGGIPLPSTIRTVNSIYLGVRYAWTKILKRKLKDLVFRMQWINFWFYVPGMSLNPYLIAKLMFESGYDVVLSNINEPVILKCALDQRKIGRVVWSSYDYKIKKVLQNPTCLGLTYINWQPGFLYFIQMVRAKKFKNVWLNLEPNWKNLNDDRTSGVGFLLGPTVPDKVKKTIHQTIQELSSGKLIVFKGPLTYYDGTLFLKPGQEASEKQLYEMNKLISGIIANKYEFKPHE